MHSIRSSVVFRSLVAANCSVVVFLSLLLFCENSLMADDGVRRLAGSDGTPFSSAVVVSDHPLVFTRQFKSAGTSAELKSQSTSQQLGTVLQQIDQCLPAGSSAQLVKLNFYVVNEAVASEALAMLGQRYSKDTAPAVSFVVSRLPLENALIAADAVFAVSPEWSLPEKNETVAALPSGRRIFISGQAEQSESLAEATTKTLQSLSNTLKFLGRSDVDIVQLKAFVQPMSDAAVVKAEVEKFYQGQTAPPLVLVEWKSSRTVPIEIELVAAGGDLQPDQPSAEYLTPPGMTASPVYCRVCRTNHRSLIYTSGLYSGHDQKANPDATTNGEREVTNVFATLKSILDETQSDFRHLVKATYYVSTDSASVSLNKLRPNYYDPDRPPAASKAVVDSTGVAGLGLTIDMIAVPKGDGP